MVSVLWSSQRMGQFFSEIVFSGIVFQWNSRTAAQKDYSEEEVIKLKFEHLQSRCLLIQCSRLQVGQINTVNPKVCPRRCHKVSGMATSTVMSLQCE